MKKFLLVSILAAGLITPSAALAHDRNGDRVVKGAIVGGLVGYAINSSPEAVLLGAAAGAVINNSRHRDYHYYDRHHRDRYHNRWDDRRYENRYHEHRRWHRDERYCRKESEYRRGDRSWYRGCMDRHEDRGRYRY